MTLTPQTRDALSYGGSTLAGVVLAKSFGAKLLGIAIGGASGLMLAAWWLSQPKKTA